jgi:hypothetical protein
MAAEPISVKDALAQIAQLAKQLNAVATTDLRSPDALDTLESALQRLPEGTLLGAAFDEARAQLAASISAERRQRSIAFGRIEAEFIRLSQAKDKTVREQNEGWRVGPLEFQFRRDQARARIRYNHEELLGWKPIANVADLEKLEGAALKLLASAELPEELLVNAAWDAYASERDRRTNDRKQKPELVPLVDFYREFRAALVRFELAGHKPDRKLQYSDLPRWKYQYNLDRYRALGQSIPTERRLGFHTGSQLDVQRGMGFTLSGLDAQQDYKTVCYVMAV